MTPALAVIIGGAGGLGRGLAAKYGDRGMRILLADIDEDALQEVKSELAKAGVDVEVTRLNVADAADLEGLATAVRDEDAELAMVFNTVGVYSQGSVWEMPISDWAWQLDVNFWGVLHSIRAFIPLLMEQGHGHFVTTASSITLSSRGGYPGYDASKHAVWSVTETLKHDLAAVGSDVKVSILIPGAIRSRLYESDRHRPAEYGGTSSSEPSIEDREDMRRYLESHGADPRVLADILVAQLDEGAFYVFGREEDKDYATARLHDIREGFLSDSPFARRPGPGSQLASGPGTAS